MLPGLAKRGKDLAVSAKASMTSEHAEWDSKRTAIEAMSDSNWEDAEKVSQVAGKEDCSGRDSCVPSLRRRARSTDHRGRVIVLPWGDNQSAGSRHILYRVLAKPAFGPVDPWHTSYESLASAVAAAD